MNCIRGRCQQTLVRAVAYAVACAVAVVSARGAAPRRIVVAGGDRFEPLMFMNSRGEPDGMYVDLWRLWSKKTGVEVDFRLTDWGQCIPALFAGEADAVYGVSYTASRAEVLDFSDPHSEVPTYLYFHESMGGVRGLGDVAGFPVGFLEGSFVAPYLIAEAPSVRPIPYVNYEALVRAAGTGRIRVFLGEDPVVPFFFTKTGLPIRFRRTAEPVLTTDLRVAVRKGENELVGLIEDGFAAMTAAEREEIRKAWGGHAVRTRFPWHWVGIAAIAVMATVGLMVLWNALLYKRVVVATQSLRSNEERLSVLFDHAPDGYYLCDMKGTFLDGNRAAEEIIGYKREELIGKTFLEAGILRKRDIPKAAALLARSNVGRSTGPDEFVLVRGDGTDALVEVRTHVVTIHGTRVVLGIARDITARRKAEEERLEARALLEAAVAQSPSGILIADAPDVAIRMANAAAFNIRGGNPQLLTGIKVEEHTRSWQTFRPDGSPYTPEELPLSRAVLKGETTLAEEVIIRDQEGTDHWVSANAAPIRDADGEVTAGIVVFQDITEQRRLEEQLQQAQRMEAVGRLAGGVAHDFNNLLMGIMNYIELCRHEVEPNHPVCEFLDEITREAQRSADLTRQLLAFARRQTIEPKVLDLDGAVEGLLRMLHRLIGESIELQWRSGAGGAAVRMDASQLDQILANLAVNARDAIGGVGTLSIESAAVTLDDAYCAASAEATPGEYVRLSVCDDGQGMDAATLRHVFEPFFTTKPSSEGTGLGLATVYGIVRQNMGFIEVASTPGKGTRFDVYLPRCREEPVDAAAPAAEARPPHGSETVLVVEDEAAIRVTVSAFLERAGYTVLVAEKPEDALALVAENQDAIDLIITDVVMPDMSGGDLVACLARKCDGLRCIFMSGYTEDIIASHGILDRDIDFLPKPFSRSQLLQTVRDVLDRDAPQAAG